jgi:hypothetical protein
VHVQDHASGSIARWQCAFVLDADANLPVICVEGLKAPGHRPAAGMTAAAKGSSYFVQAKFGLNCTQMRADYSHQCFA